MMTTCLTCGELTDQAYCQDHQPTPAPKTQSATERGYDHRWQKLSLRARRIQPFCTDCGTTEDLQCDHTPKAWERYYTGKNIRLIDVDVVCGKCNINRGPARGEHTRGIEATEHLPDPRYKAKFQTDSDLKHFGGGRGA